MASLYLHIPFCERKCIYCDFYSIENLKPIQTFAEALEAEIGLYASYAPQETIETIFFGGGTPSLLSIESLNRILEALRKHFIIREQAEVTLEANPGTIDKKKLQDFRSLGINRLSFGVQSFHQRELEFLGRIHTSEQAVTGVRLAQDVGFDNINIDLIFSLPGQTIEEWNVTLEKAISLGTKHISAYSLIVEPNTPLFRMVQSKQITPSPTENEAEMYEYTMAFFKKNGFEHYEVSNYARKGYQSRHNYNYWNHTNYIGFGPSAHSFWGRRRWWNVKNLQLYIDKIASNLVPVEADETLTDTQLCDEAIMLGLRSSGIELKGFKNNFGIDLLAAHESNIRNLLVNELVSIENDMLRLTDKGYVLCDSIAESLLIQLEPEGVPCN